MNLRKRRFNKVYICESSYITIAVTIALRTHLFPFRTQKLSSIALKVLGWTRPGRIGSCRISLFLVSSAVEHSAVNRRVVGSNPTRGAKKRLVFYKSFFMSNLYEFDYNSSQRRVSKVALSINYLSKEDKRYLLGGIPTSFLKNELK